MKLWKRPHYTVLKRFWQGVKLPLQSQCAKVSSFDVLYGSPSVSLRVFISPGYYISRVSNIAQRGLRALAGLGTSLTLKPWSIRNTVCFLSKKLKWSSGSLPRKVPSTILTSVWKTGVLCTLQGLVQGSANCSCKGPDNKYSQLCRTYVLRHNYSSGSMKAPQTTCTKTSMAVLQ